MFRRNSFRNWSIRRKLVVLFLMMSFVTGVTIALPMSVFDFLGLKSAIATDMATLADVLARDTIAALTFRDVKSAEDTLTALHADASIVAACIYDAEGRPFAKYARSGDLSGFVPPVVRKEGSEFQKDRLIQFRPIAFDGEAVGTIYIESDLRRLNQRRSEYFVVIGGTLFLALTLSVVLAHALRRPIYEPLTALVATARAISTANDYTIRANLSSNDEFGLLGSAFNRMLEQIHRRDQELLLHRRDLEQAVEARTGELVIANAQLTRAEEKYRSIFEDAVIGIFQTTIDGRPISINRALAQIHGYESAEELMHEVDNVALQLFVDPHRMDEIARALDRSSEVRGVELELYRKDGSKKWGLANIRAVRDSQGNITLIEGTIEDITERKLAQEQVHYLAYYDALTGLANRTLLQDRVGKALASAQRRNEKVGLLFLDLDRFKIINDSLGHSFGDLLLQQVAERLKKMARAQDTVARIGGDEFVIALTAVRDMPDVAVAVERVMEAMTSEFVIQGRTFHVNCSIGVSLFPDHGADSETLIKNADAAMYTAKENGRNGYRFFSDDMNAQVVERMTLEHGLRLAMERRELFLMYQLQADIATGKVVGVEALLRWQHPELGLLSPDRFIRIAENCGLIVPMGEWVLKTACSTAKSWQERGLPAVPVAVNVSAIQFRQEGFDAVLSRVLSESGLAPEYLELELTESVLLSNVDVTQSVLRSLRSMGIRLAIDDFGTGYSSLAYLKQFPVGKLKIDRSFIRNIPGNADDAAIAGAIISMGKNLNLKVIAEGVETEAQLTFLREHGCDEIQGYYLSRPLTADQLVDKLHRLSGPKFATACFSD